MSILSGLISSSIPIGVVASQSDLAGLACPGFAPPVGSLQTPLLNDSSFGEKITFCKKKCGYLDFDAVGAYLTGDLIVMNKSLKILEAKRGIVGLEPKETSECRPCPVPNTDGRDGSQWFFG